MNEKPKFDDCGTCTDFQDWMNQSKDKVKEKVGAKMDRVTDDEAKKSYYTECPLFRNQLGRATWSYLHTMAAYYPSNPSQTEQTKMKDFIDTFAKTFPCKHCSTDFQEEVEKNPPRVENNEQLSKWFCEQHNVVNQKLGKAEFDCDRVFERWKFGYSKNPKCKGYL